MVSVQIFTIGFTQSSAEHFFGRLADAGVARVVDVRLNNSSQLAGFAKAQDLPFFLRELVGAEYRTRAAARTDRVPVRRLQEEKGKLVAVRRGLHRPS